MHEKFETVAVYCPTDCIYRGILCAYNLPFCQYALVEGASRKCKVSECDKYKPGERIKPRMTTDYMIEWEYEFYDTDADAIWRRFKESEI